MHRSRPTRSRPWPVALFLLAAAVTAPAGSASARAETPPGAAPPPPEAGSLPDRQEDLERMFDMFFKVGLDLEHPLAVRDLRIKRDTMDLTLTDGTLYFSRPIEGRQTGAYFIGTASMRVLLQNAIDRKLLRKAYGKEKFEEAIGEVVLRFDDGTEKEIRAATTPGTAPPGDPAAIWNDRLKIDAYANDLQMDFIESLINGQEHTAFFMADVRVKDGKDWYNFTRRGGHRIENALYRERAMGAAGKRWYEPLTMFHRIEDYDEKGNYHTMPAADTKDVTALRHVEMTIEIPNTKTVNIDARLTVEARRDGVRAVRFDFVNNLSGAWDETGRQVVIGLTQGPDGAPLPRLHRWHQLIVVLPRPLAKGEKTVVHVTAAEDTIIQLTPKSYWIYTTYAWFPQIGHNGGRYTFDWTVKVAHPNRAAGSGDLVREWQEGTLNCGRWTSEVPVQFASFIFGEFKPTDGEYKREDGGTGEVPLRIFTIQGGSEHFQGSTKNILHNIGLGIKTYETIYGPFPFAQLDIAEMAHGLGFAQSPAGILLVGGSLGKAGGGGGADQLIYHELAHQWWGHQIGWVGEEDAWISESWAEYSAALITEAIDKAKFRRKIDDWKRNALEADPHGTIATAYRSNSVEYPDARTHLLYDKGPYVVHMLRTWMGWEKFSKFVSTLQTKYRNRDINTDTLARESSALLGYDMFPFFDQWVRDSGIPRVRWSWSSAPEPDGKHLVTIKVRQEDEANFKIMMLPVTLDFGQGEPVVVLKPVLKATMDLQLRVPKPPKAVRLDDAATQLAVFIADGVKK